VTHTPIPSFTAGDEVSSSSVSPVTPGGGLFKTVLRPSSPDLVTSFNSYQSGFIGSFSHGSPNGFQGGGVGGRATPSSGSARPRGGGLSGLGGTDIKLRITSVDAFDPFAASPGYDSADYYSGGSEPPRISSHQRSGFFIDSSSANRSFPDFMQFIVSPSGGPTGFQGVTSSTAAQFGGVHNIDGDQPLTPSLENWVRQVVRAFKGDDESSAADEKFDQCIADLSFVSSSSSPEDGGLSSERASGSQAQSFIGCLTDLDSIIVETEEFESPMVHDYFEFMHPPTEISPISPRADRPSSRGGPTGEDHEDALPLSGELAARGEDFGIVFLMNRQQSDLQKVYWYLFSRSLKRRFREQLIAGSGNIFTWFNQGEFHESSYILPESLSQLINAMGTKERSDLDSVFQLTHELKTYPIDVYFGIGPKFFKRVRDMESEIASFIVEDASRHMVPISPHQFTAAIEFDVMFGSPELMISSNMPDLDIEPIVVADPGKRESLTWDALRLIWFQMREYWPRQNKQPGIDFVTLKLSLITNPDNIYPTMDPAVRRYVDECFGNYHMIDVTLLPMFMYFSSMEEITSIGRIDHRVLSLLAIMGRNLKNFSAIDRAARLKGALAMATASFHDRYVARWYQSHRDNRINFSEIFSAYFSEFKDSEFVEILSRPVDREVLRLWNSYKDRNPGLFDGTIEPQLPSADGTIEPQLTSSERRGPTIEFMKTLNVVSWYMSGYEDGYWLDYEPWVFITNVYGADYNAVTRGGTQEQLIEFREKIYTIANEVLRHHYLSARYVDPVMAESAQAEVSSSVEECFRITDSGIVEYMIPDPFGPVNHSPIHSVVFANSAYSKLIDTLDGLIGDGGKKETLSEPTSPGGKSSSPPPAATGRAGGLQTKKPLGPVVVSSSRPVFARHVSGGDSSPSPQTVPIVVLPTTASPSIASEAASTVIPPTQLNGAVDDSPGAQEST